VSPAMAARFTAFFYCFPQKTRRRIAAMRGLAAPEVVSLRIPGGKKIRFYEWGQGPCVLLIHGWGGSGSQWQSFVPALLDAGYKVVVFDAPAHGESPGVTTSTLEISSAVETYAARTGRLHAVIAHSFGGVVALYAARKKVQYDALVCIATPDPGRLFAKFVYLLKLPAPVARRVKERLTARYARMGLDLWQDFALDRLRTGYTGRLLHVYDRRDEAIPASENRDVAAALAPTDSLVTEGLGHYRMLASPQAINQVLRFLSERTMPGAAL
jgi:pimeloyl-ACP methyl ester carboxylesterase